MRIDRMKKELDEWVEGGQGEENREFAAECILACFRQKESNFHYID
jgi:hypothetical protein